MELKLKRTKLTDACTQGELYVDGEFECYTLEDVVRSQKIKGQTAIPAGTYSVIVSYSPRFERRLPLLLDVPNFEGVRIHSGNRAEDTEGCILVGRYQGVDWVGQSRAALTSLLRKLQGGVATLEITNEFESK